MVRLLKLVFFLVTPILAQTRVVLEPQPLKITERILGSRDFGLWTCTIESSNAFVHRTAITSASPVNELTLEMSRDILARATKGNKLYLLGRGFDMLSPPAAQGLSGYAFFKNSAKAQWIASGITAAGIIRNLFRGTAPNSDLYLANLLPERVTCTEGMCGTWYIVTGLVPNAARVSFEISIFAERLAKIRQYNILAYGTAWPE